MTKKDYELIAEAIKDAKSHLLYATTNAGETKRAVSHIADILAIRLEKENPRFNADKFYQACGGQE